MEKRCVTAKKISAIRVGPSSRAAQRRDRRYRLSQLACAGQRSADRRGRSGDCCAGASVSRLGGLALRGSDPRIVAGGKPTDKASVGRRRPTDLRNAAAGIGRGARTGRKSVPGSANRGCRPCRGNRDRRRATTAGRSRSRFSFENFVVGKPNELAHAAARRVAEACSGPVRMVPFNPLYLYGGVGLGKTHLMHAIAWHVHNSGCARKVIYLSAEKFMHQFIRALRFKSMMDFKDEFRSVDLLMIDDVQFISGKESTQEEFFHTFNALVDQNRQIVISADKSPSDLEGLEERMRSRLGWGLVADLHPTTYELRLGILQSKAEQANMQIPRKVMEFLAHQDHFECPRAGGGTQPHRCQHAARRAGHHARKRAGGIARSVALARAAGDDRRNPTARR